MIQKRDKIKNISNKAYNFLEAIKTARGYKYTINHDTEKYPAAILYGTWSVVYLKRLVGGDEWISEEEKSFILNVLNGYRLKNGLFYPEILDKQKFPKSKEYMQLHCYNYAVGAAVELNPEFDFQSSYMDAYLNADFLERWLNQRSLERPWEESNNIVNVASYLALCNDNGQSAGKERLYHMLEWHNKVQNPRTGGFENFGPSRKNILQSMAGAVHNFHIHHYLGEPMNFESKIAQNVIPFLFEGPLTACLSIDFVELACKTIGFSENKYELEQALIYHLNALIKYQNSDGGWYENETPKKPTTANGMKEEKASSNSYATWFRMASIGMIAITLLGDDPNNWHFRRTLGMGYANDKWYITPIDSDRIDYKVVFKYNKINFPHIMRKKLITTAVMILR